jgi:acid phosphatase type 7
MKQRKRRVLIAALGLLALALTSIRFCDIGTAFLAVGTHNVEGLLVKPYLQLGPAPSQNSGDLCVLWHSEDVSIPWSVEYRSVSESAWRTAGPLEHRQISVPGVTTHWVIRVALKDLKPGVEFFYRLRKSEQIVFESSGRARRGSGQPHRFVAFGDCAANTFDQRAIAYQTSEANPDFVMITGDIVYSRGRIAEYRDRFWPVYNADVPLPSTGAPLLRSRLFVAAVGNHDTGKHDLTTFADSLAYFLYWDQPLNGPLAREGGPLAPNLGGDDLTKTAFRKSAGNAYPRMSNFSFDYGDVHWTVLDSNYYADWTDPEARAWLEQDLAAAASASWRFVAFHHPGFNSSKAHYGDQRMRLIAPMLEAGHVDVVFNGHVHNYQRTYPLRFRPAPRPNAGPARQDVPIPGEWTLDTQYDGQSRARPDGIIYLVTGGGGAALYNPEQDDDQSSWQPFTKKLVSRVHSLTIVDVDARTLLVRQVAVNGDELDRFSVTK